MHSYQHLDNINCPDDLKNVAAADIPELCAEIREFLIENISKTGGHLASNLGVVELTVAAHRVFNSPDDSIMFDVGHQCYVHKIITGRKNRFDQLRSYEGISGFLRPEESPHDCFVSGHASNSISAALGIARARQLAGKNSKTVCIVGDGALTGGMIYEALNDAGQSGVPLVVIFNDNEMSIGKNVGALANRLSKIRLKPRYFSAKSKTKAFLGRFKWGSRVTASISRLKGNIRRALLKESIFEIMGFRYLGPADGHDEALVERLLSEAAGLGQPVVVHLKTVKGKGYYPSEKSPGDYHGVSAFDIVAGPGKAGVGSSFSHVFGSYLCRLAEGRPDICAVTAAMEANTGLTPFAGMYPDRFFDVGIAEEHAVTMSAGLAAGGMVPVCAIYSTFLQRGYDQLLHDVAICGQHVVFAVDRAGLVGADGQTHQGAFDVPYLLTVPGMALFSPASYSELKSAMDSALALKGPVAIRYPRGSQLGYSDDTFGSEIACLAQGKDITIVSYGIMINQALSAGRQLLRAGISADIIKINRLDDYDCQVINASVAKTGRLIVVEDCAGKGCLGTSIAAALLQGGIQADISLLNLGDTFVKEGKVEQLYAKLGIDSDGIVNRAAEMAAHK